MLAYSTISQLGFMFMAAGMRFYAGAMFMLVAHAFYKALMFLGAGSVMHGMHEETDLKTHGRAHPPDADHRMDVRDRGALAGRGPAARRASSRRTSPRDREPHRRGPGVYVLGTLGALISALYIGRLLFLAFFGDRGARRPSTPTNRRR